GIVESGQQKLALRINDPGLRTVPGINFSRAAYGDNAVAQHGQGFRFRTRFVHSPDLRVSNDQVSSRFALGKGAARQQQSENEDECGRSYSTAPYCIPVKDVIPKAR